jgi:ER lumen protein retaining receptor
MAAIANGIDFLCDFFSGKTSKLGSAADHSGMTASIKILYAAFTFFWFVTFGMFSDSDFSAVMTAGVTLQALGFLMLCVKVHAQKSVEGLSSKMLSMFVIFYCFRLTSTALKDGYIPVDKSGDFMMQVFEGISLLCVCHLVYCMHKTFAHSYQEEHDTLSIMPLVVPCIVLGYFVHGDFNKNEFFDFIWATSLNLETLTLVPQLWMMAKIGGKVDSATSHFVACMVLACVCRFTFWWWAYNEQSTDIAGLHILIAHIVQIIFCADFMFYYVQAWINGTAVHLPAEKSFEM